MRERKTKRNNSNVSELEIDNYIVVPAVSDMKSQRRYIRKTMMNKNIVATPLRKPNTNNRNKKSKKHKMMLFTTTNNMDVYVDD